MARSIVLVSPPVTKPSEPNLSGPAAAQALCWRGVQAHAIDASIGWYAHTLRREALVALADAAAPERPHRVLAPRPQRHRR